MSLQGFFNLSHQPPMKEKVTHDSKNSNVEVSLLIKEVRLTLIL